MERDASLSQTAWGERALLDQIVETSPIGIVVVVASGKIAFCNAAGERILGLGRDEAQSRAYDDPAWRITDDEGNPLPDEALPFRKVMAERAPVYGERRAITHANGRRVSLSINAAPLLRADATCEGIVASLEDVTEEVWAEQALRESEERYRRISAAVTDYIYSVRIERGRAVETRHGVGCAAVTGYASEELDQDPMLWYRMIIEQDRPLVEAFSRQVATGVAADPIEHRIARKDGQVRWVRNTPVLHHDAEGQLVAFDGLIRDITERKQAEHALAESEAQLASIVRVAPIGIGLVVNRVLKQVNDRLCAMIGYTREELIGQSARMVYVSDEDFAHVGREKYRQIAERGTGSVETHWRCKDGRVIDVLLSSTPLDPADLLQGVTFTALDITERKRAEEALRESEERLRLAVEAADLGYWDWEVSSGRLTFGGGQEAIYGRVLSESDQRRGVRAVSLEDYLGLIHPEDRPAILDGRARLLAGAPGFDVEMRIPLPDGSVRWVAARGQAHRDSQGRLTRVLGVTRDVTEPRRAEQERRDLEAQLQQQQRLESLGTLAAGVAHEINNPLTGIMNYAQLIVNRLDEGHPSRRHAARIVDESERVSEIVRNLLAFSRQDEQMHSPARLADVLARAVALVRSLLRRDQITLETDIPDDLPLLKCRSQQIQQVLLNLITNARDALNQRFPTANPDKRIHVRAGTFEEDGQPWIRITVEDTGTGVSADAAQHIFEPFFTSKPRGVGTGLGLSISYGIVKAHHGRLTLENPPQGPTRFHVDLPADASRTLAPGASGSREAL